MSFNWLIHLGSYAIRQWSWWTDFYLVVLSYRIRIAISSMEPEKSSEDLSSQKSSLCFFKEYGNIFGERGKNVHKIRLCDVAAVDYVFAIIFAIVVCKITNTPLVLSTILAFILGIILHILFGVQTSTLSYLGINC